MTLARECGLDVPPVGLAAPGIPVFCAERFDRSPAAQPGRIGDKIHQEDFCQVLGVEPERKYEADGGPGLKKCATVIRRYSSLPAEDLMRFVRWVGFNYLIGNEDAHAKNLAVVYLPEGVRLAPPYDLVSTAVYPDLDRRLAMKLGGAWDVRSVQRKDWLRFAAAVDVPWEQVRVVLLELASKVQAAASKTLAFPISDQIAGVMARHAASLERALGVR